MLAEPIQQQIQSLEAEYQVLLEKLEALPFPIEPLLLSMVSPQ